MDRISNATLLKIIIDFSCAVIVACIVLLINFYAQPFQRGFFCNDESLAHPVRDSTVTNNILYFPGIFIPIGVMIIGEYFFMISNNGKSSSTKFEYLNFRWVTLVYEKIGIFLFGVAVTTFVTDAAKHTIGRLRPHFLEVCKPNIDCSLPENQHVYIENFTCTAPGLTAGLLREIRLSFPSGHSSFITYVTIYFTLYLQLRMTWKGSKLLKHFLQILCLTLAWLTVLSRVSNYKHHWSDVVCGVLIGTIVSLFMFCGIGDFFKDRQHQSDCVIPIGNSRTRNNIKAPIGTDDATADNFL